MQLETPFGNDYNDISVKDFHARFLETIIEISPVSKYKSAESTKRLALARKPEVTVAVGEKAPRHTFKMMETLGDRSPRVSSHMPVPERTRGRAHSFSTWQNWFAASRLAEMTEPGKHSGSAELTDPATSRGTIRRPSFNSLFPNPNSSSRDLDDGNRASNLDLQGRCRRFSLDPSFRHSTLTINSQEVLPPAGLVPPLGPMCSDSQISVCTDSSTPSPKSGQGRVEITGQTMRIEITRASHTDGVTDFTNQKADKSEEVESDDSEDMDAQVLGANAPLPHQTTEVRLDVS